MSQLLSAMMSELGPGVLAQLGGSVGASPQQTQSAMAAALPALIAGLARNSATPQGAQSLSTALERDHGPNLMDSLGPLAGALLGGAAGGGGGGGGGAGALLGGLLGGSGGGGGGGGGLGALLGALAGGSAPAAGRPRALDGGGILGHVLGDQQGAVVQQVAKVSGMSPQAVSALLPVLAPIVMSALGTLKSKQGLDAGGVASLLAQEHTAISGSAAPAPKAAAPGGLDLGSIGSALLQSGALSQLFR